jgi:hypothetical protein
VKHCGSVPSDVWDYFCRGLDRTTESRKARQRQQLLREEVAAEGNVVHNIDSDNDEELQRAIHLFREEAHIHSEYDSKVDNMSMGWVLTTTTKWWFLWQIKEVNL